MLSLYRQRITSAPALSTASGRVLVSGQLFSIDRTRVKMLTAAVVRDFPRDFRASGQTIRAACSLLYRAGLPIVFLAGLDTLTPTHARTTSSVTKLSLVVPS